MSPQSLGRIVLRTRLARIALLLVSAETLRDDGRLTGQAALAYTARAQHGDVVFSLMPCPRHDALGAGEAVSAGTVRFCSAPSVRIRDDRLVEVRLSHRSVCCSSCTTPAGRYAEENRLAVQCDTRMRARRRVRAAWLVAALD